MALENRIIVLFSLFVGILSFALRLSSASFSSIYLDEAVFIHNGQWWDAIQEYASRDSNPSLYPSIQFFWTKLFGISELGVRSLSALFSGVLVGVGSYQLSKLFNWKATFAFAILLLFSNPIHLYGQEGRAYALLYTLGTLSFLFALRYLKEKQNRHLLLWAVVSLLALYTHYTALIIVGSSFLVLILTKKWQAMAMGVVPFILFLPELLSLDSNKTEATNWLKESDLFLVLSDLLQVNVFAFYGVIVIIISYSLISKKKLSKLHFVCLLAIPVTMVGVYLFDKKAPIVTFKYLSFTVPIFIITFSACYSLIRQKWALLVLTSLFVIPILNYEHFQKKGEDWRSAVHWMDKSMTKNSMCFVLPVYHYRAVAYYHDRQIFEQRDLFPLLGKKAYYFMDEISDDLWNFLDPEILYVVDCKSNELGASSASTKCLEERFVLKGSKWFDGIHINIWQKRRQ